MNMENLLTSDHAELDAQAAKIFAACDANDAGRVFQSLDLFWARLAMHIRAEHLHLFPALRRGGGARSAENGGLSRKTVEERLAELKADHDFFMRELAAAIAILRETRDVNRPSETAPALARVRGIFSGVAARLRIHNEREETEVYRWSAALLDPAERRALERKIRRELDNLPPRFARSEGGRN